MSRIRSALGRLVRRARPATCVVLLLMMPLLAGCEQKALLDLVAQMAVEWAAENQLITVAQDGSKSINWVQVGVYQGQKWWSGTTGNLGVDTALDVGPIAHSVYQADKLAEEGMANQDPAKLEEAIDKRPGDWNYRDQKAAILAATGDNGGAQVAFDESETLVKQRVREGGNCRGLYQNMLRGRMAALERQLEIDPENTFLAILLIDANNALNSVNANEPESPCQ
jgi:hypothetical protein